MAARAMWKANVQADGVELPVKLYSAVEDRRIHFRLLDPEGRVPVRQRMVDPETGDEVPRDQVRRGIEVESGAIVMLEDEELDALEPEPSRQIEVTHFVPAEQIDHRWYDRPYYLGPDGDEDAYFALAQALRKEGREGVARWTMRKKRYIGALRWEGDHLLLMTLRYPAEVVPSAALPRPQATKPSAAERRMAEQLVGMLEGEFDPTDFRDEYRDRVLELVEAKAKGEVIPMREPKKKRRDQSLERLLEQSVASASERGASAA